jgi:transcriptional regulator GlxA family with amidase domain
VYHVACALYPEALATSVTLPAEILRAAAQLSMRRRGRGLDARVKFFGLADTPTIALETGPSLALDGPITDLQDCDLLVLPAIWRHPRRVLRRFSAHLEILQRLHNRGAIICSVGSASTLLAEAGLLDGRAATTHWQDFDRFATTYPAVDLKRRHLITQSERIYCVGSVNSIADYMVHLLGQWYGEGIARAVEAQFSPEARQSFATAAFLQQAPESHHDALVRESQDRMESDPGADHSLGSLARHVGLSPRSLGRRFREATGQSPMHYLRRLRLREAKALLLRSDLSIAEIAWRCGYSSPSRFTQAFRAATDLSPRNYRVAVRGKRFGALPSGSRTDPAPDEIEGSRRRNGSP